MPPINASRSDTLRTLLRGSPTKSVSPGNKAPIAILNSSARPLTRLAFPEPYGFSVHPAAVPLRGLDHNSFSGKVENAVGGARVPSNHRGSDLELACTAGRQKAVV